MRRRKTAYPQPSEPQTLEEYFDQLGRLQERKNRWQSDLDTWTTASPGGSATGLEINIADCDAKIGRLKEVFDRLNKPSSFREQ